MVWLTRIDYNGEEFLIGTYAAKIDPKILPPSLEPDLYHLTDNNSSLDSDDDPAQVVERSVTTMISIPAKFEPVISLD